MTAAEILDKHLELRNWTKTVPKHGNLYNTLLDAVNEALSIADVSHQRELLLAFVKDWYKDNPLVSEEKQVGMVDKWIASL